MATSTFYANVNTGAIMISNPASDNTLAIMLASPSNYLDQIRFHSNMNFLTVKGSLFKDSSSFAGFSRDSYSVSSGGDCFNSGTTYTTLGPTTKVQKVSFGTSPVSNPTFCLLEYNGTVYADFYDGLSTADVTRRVFVAYNSSSNTLELVAITTAAGDSATTQTLTNVYIHAVA